MANGIGVGIDVSKDTLDVATSEGSIKLRVTNDAAGLARVVDVLGELNVHRVLLEASGGYERDALLGLFEAGLPMVLIQPVRARHFARALGRYAKTDAIDALMLARMAQLAVDDVPLWAPTEDALSDLKALVERRQNLLVIRDAEKKRLRLARPIVRGDIEAAIVELTKSMRDLERRIGELIATSNPIQAEVGVLEAVSGMGRISAVTLLVALPELGTLTREEISSLAGVAPMNRDSGTWSGTRFIRGGRAQARRALYMAALVASRSNPVIKVRYRSLLERGKKPKLALVACMRKLLIHLNSLMRAYRSGPTNAALQLS
jgi:transposase